jgi:hypothetical protein
MNQKSELFFTKRIGGSISFYIVNKSMEYVLTDIWVYIDIILELTFYNMTIQTIEIVLIWF